jgi:hypothetical protein
MADLSKNGAKAPQKQVIGQIEPAKPYVKFFISK